jgi:pimeloyl-ACP methyl ester carboxylesterase
MGAADRIATKGRSFMFSLLARRVHCALVAPLLLPFLLLFGADTDKVPNAVDASYSVHGILNGKFPFNDPVFIVSWGEVSHGTLTVAAHFNGFSQESFTYEPGTGYTGDDSFTYHACDSLGQCVDGTIDLSVVNNAPHAVPDSYSLHGILQHGGDFPVTINDSDPDHDPIHVVSVTQASNGVFTYHFLHDSFTYEPRAGFAGTDSVSYTICDSLGLCDSTTITLIVVNHPPVANRDDFTIQANETLFANSPGGVLKNDSDPDHDPFSVSGYAQSPHGHVISLLNDGSLIYKPNQGFVGQDSFNYTVCDYLGACANGMVVIEVQGETPTPTPTPVATPVPSPSPPPPPSPTPTPAPLEPLIFIPGIGGSYLDEEGGRNLWLGGLATDRTRLRLNDPPVDFQGKPITIKASDVLRESTRQKAGYQHLIDALKQKAGYVEYQVNNDPARRTGAGCDLSQKPNQPTLFIFAYDWRQSNVLNANALRDYVGCVRSFYPDRQINILTHSMGGLIARRYIIDNPSSHNVKRLVTIAAPWLGAPKALYILETGNFFNVYLIDQFTSDLFKSLVEFFPSVHQILPSRSYYNLAGSPFGELAGKRTWDVNLSGQVETNYSADDVAKLLDTIQFKGSMPARAGNEFHDRSGQDNWHEDSSGVQYFHIYGVQYWNQTVGKVVALKHLQFDWQGNTVERNRYDFIPVAGDGTVPVVSAKRTPDLNAPNVTLKNFGPTYLGANDASHEHNGLNQNDDVIDYILSCLMNESSAKSGPLDRESSNRSRQSHHSRRPTATQDDNAVGNIYDLKLEGVTPPVIRDAFGNDSSPVGDTPFAKEIPNVTTYVSGEDCFQLLLPADLRLGESYTVSFASTGKPMSIDYDKSQGDSDTATQLVRYLDLNLAAGTKVQLTFDARGPLALVCDQDGDGVFETVIPATASAMGAAARDREEPTIAFQETSKDGRRLILINASDSDSGVRVIRYSLDGMTFQTYDGPIFVDTCLDRAIYAVADDNVGNRSGKVSYNLVNQPPDISLARPSVNSLWPPNHKMVGISILGVQDPDCDRFSIAITRVIQDEPVNGSGDGNTCPDAQGLGIASTLLRAERNGGGNGRVYTVYFTATDVRGGNSSGSVKVRVPQNVHDPAVEDRVTFVSTTCP